MSKLPTCPSCVFFAEHHNPAPNNGQCRFNPPTVVYADGKTKTVWPVVWHNSFCGQHTVPVEET